MLALGPGVVMCPTVGMMTPGYFLAISKSHVDCFARLAADSLIEIDAWLRELFSRLDGYFGDYFVFEHGSGGDAERSGGCITHAHFHLIPVGDLRFEVARRLKAKPLRSLDDLTTLRDEDYALVGRPGEWSAKGGVTLPGQWIRRILAGHLAMGEEWDWALFPGDRVLRDTMRRIEGPR